MYAHGWEGCQHAVKLLLRVPVAVQGVKMAIHDKFGDEVDDVVRVAPEQVSAGGQSVEVPQID
jgi:hypothetical protein